MADLHIKVGGAWKAIDDASVKVSGAWKQVDAVYVKVSNAWKQVWQALSYAISGEGGINGSAPAGTSNAGIRINTDGTIDKLVDGVYTQIDAATDWVIPNSGDKTNVRFRCTNNGDTLAGIGGSEGPSQSTGTWIAPTVNLLWYIETENPFPISLNLTLEMSIDAGSSTHDTAVYLGSAEA